MQTGKLDQRVILQSDTEAANSSGEVVKSYTTVATVWAHVISQKGDEAFESARVNAKRTVRIKIRFRSDVDLKWRCVWNDENYNIIEVDRSQRRLGELWVTAEAVGAT